MSNLTEEQTEFWNTLKTPAKELRSTNVYAWQKDLFNRLQGVAKGEMTVICTGRQTGKSMLTQQMVEQWYGRVKRK